MEQLAKSLPPGGRVFRVFEGERVSPDYVQHPGDVVFELVNLWRDEDDPIQAPVEAIPGYQRPVNWLPIQARESKQPGRAEMK